MTTLRRYFKTSPARLPPTAAGFFVRVTQSDIGPAAERTRLYIGDWWRKGALPFGGAAPG
ncbi:hypothetical protein BV511_15820 [Methylorubrum extorquens]|nr:hypothetical protein BV511_15820 [Methylorubrum extorquens]